MNEWTKRIGAVGLGMVLCIGGWALWGTPRAAAERVDPTLPAHLTIGRPPGQCPMFRVDAERSGRVVELPNEPKERWHRRVRGGMALPVAVDETGAIIVAAAIAELVQVGPDGTEQWHQRLGMSVASTQPVILSDGTRVVLTALGQVWGYGPGGDPRLRADLGAFGTDPRTSPLPREDGSVVIAIGTNLITLDRQGTIVSQADVGQRITGALVGDGDGIIATTDTGTVYRWASPLPPREVGTFRGLVREGGAKAEDGALLAVVDMQRLVSMDLGSGATTTRMSLYGLEGPPTMGKQSLAHIATTTGLLLSVSSAGEERRVKLAPPSTEPEDADGGVTTPVYAPASPPVLVDNAGRVAFARTDGRVGVVSPDGQVRFASKRSCGTPIALVPAGKGKFLVACRTGDLRLYGP